MSQSASMSLPVLIFDFGNVIAHFDVMRAADRLGQTVGLTGAELLDRVQSQGFAELAREYEHGRISSPDFAVRALAMAESLIDYDEFAAAWSDIFWLNEPVAQLAIQLKDQGHRLILGSNTNELHATRFRKQFADVLDRFDHLVFSHEVGAMKPDAKFYLACAAKAEAKPQDCLFIDDLPANVEGARAAGLQAIAYRDAHSLRKELASLGFVVG